MYTKKKFKAFATVSLFLTLLFSVSLGLSENNNASILKDFESLFSTLSPSDIQNIVLDQSNRHQNSVFYADNSWLYGINTGKNNKCELIKVRHDNTEWTTIDNNTNGYFASCEAVIDGYIYYSRVTNEAKELVKVRASGNDPVVIIPEYSGYIQFTEDYIYFASKEIWNEDGTGLTPDSTNLYRCDLNGQNVEIVLNKPVYYFSNFGDYILFQDDFDNSTVHLYNIITGEDTRITDVRSFWPVYDGQYLYYMTDSYSEIELKHAIWKCSLDGSISEQLDVGSTVAALSVHGNYLYYINLDDEERLYRCNKDGSNIELVTQDSYILAYEFINDTLIYFEGNEKGLITHIYFSNLDGSGKTEF